MSELFDGNELIDLHTEPENKNNKLLIEEESLESQKIKQVVINNENFSHNDFTTNIQNEIDIIPIKPKELLNSDIESPQVTVSER